MNCKCQNLCHTLGKLLIQQTLYSNLTPAKGPRILQHQSLMRLIVAVFVLGENMVVHGKDVLKLCLGLWWEVFVTICGNSVTNCDIRIWHTSAEVKLFVFLFVIKLFLNCCCSIDVLYFFAQFFFLFCDLFFVDKNLYLLSCLPT